MGTIYRFDLCVPLYVECFYYYFKKTYEKPLILERCSIEHKTAVCEELVRTRKMIRTTKNENFICFP
jgi:hypothetical protein